MLKFQSDKLVLIVSLFGFLAILIAHTDDQGQMRMEMDDMAGGGMKMDGSSDSDAHKNDH